MRILNYFSNKELDLLKQINVMIDDREYVEEDLQALSKEI